jgi:hypothetical protein
VLLGWNMIVQNKKKNISLEIPNGEPEGADIFW